MPDGSLPPRAERGRGALSNPANRFEAASAEAFDDGWGVGAPEPDTPPSQGDDVAAAAPSADPPPRQIRTTVAIVIRLANATLLIDSGKYAARSKISAASIAARAGSPIRPAMRAMCGPSFMVRS